MSQESVAAKCFQICQVISKITGICGRLRVCFFSLHLGERAGKGKRSNTSAHRALEYYLFYFSSTVFAYLSYNDTAGTWRHPIVATEAIATWKLLWVDWKVWGHLQHSNLIHRNKWGTNDAMPKKQCGYSFTQMYSCGHTELAGNTCLPQQAHHSYQSLKHNFWLL